MSTTQTLIILAFLSLTVTTITFPYVLRYARRHKIVDNPDARKLHRLPVPVLGGVAVYAGILAGCLAMWLLVRGASISWSLLAMTTMLVMGVWDDMKNLSPILRLLVQFGIVGAYMGFTGYYINNFYGFLGIHEISPWVGIPLSLIAGVGTINAINMIDGVDGYSSGFGIMACACFAAIFIAVGQSVWSCLAVIVASSLMPFFFHNVFGVKSKMFIGDGGTMMLGFLMTIFGLGAMSLRRGLELEAQGIGIIAMTLSVLCIPIFDTLRVMIVRMLRGLSPFRPDKSHLHHLFIDMGFSHLGAAISILSMNLVVILVWLLLWLCGASINVQTFAVLLMGFAVTFGFYKLMRWQQHSGPIGDDGLPQGTPLWHVFRRIGMMSHKEDDSVWIALRKIADSKWFVKR
ncbi:MAG: undecaprenyl/decaprenyl-phosphate alpha-N-acetylglucosaminyl 1-phosphate transferase [Bacteroidaceae bacterium]|nr:undecaprenyl/decaprenyl-phosphate alpha-N-acetylglucosaminyl 1-phosphate transferase [Bacteroidaceae bacterium]